LLKKLFSLFAKETPPTKPQTLKKKPARPIMESTHSEKDIRVPSEHSRKYVSRVAEMGKSGLLRYYELEGAGTRIIGAT
jgi:hypothetical protein